MTVKIQDIPYDREIVIGYIPEPSTWLMVRQNPEDKNVFLVSNYWGDFEEKWSRKDMFQHCKIPAIVNISRILMDSVDNHA